jgi:hypothetical protein
MSDQVPAEPLPQESDNSGEEGQPTPPQDPSWWPDEGEPGSYVPPPPSEAPVQT